MPKNLSLASQTVTGDLGKGSQEEFRKRKRRMKVIITAANVNSILQSSRHPTGIYLPCHRYKHLVSLILSS